MSSVVRRGVGAAVVVAICVYWTMYKNSWCPTPRLESLPLVDTKAAAPLRGSTANGTADRARRGHVRPPRSR